MSRTKLHLAATLIIFSLTALAAAQQSSAPSIDAGLAQSLSDAERMVTKDPSRAEHLYNLGVLQYRAGQLTQAGESFRLAAERLNNNLAARSTYNRGTTRYREALEALQSAQQSGATPVLPQDPTQPGTDAATDPQTQAIASLEESLQQLKDSIRANPSSSDNVDARANAELAHRLLKKLKEQQKQEQQNQQSQDPKDGEKREEQKSQDSNEQKNQDGESSDGQPKDSSQQESGKSDPKSDGKPDDAQQQPSQAPPKPQDGDQQKPDPSQAEEKPSGEPEPSPEGKPEANQPQPSDAKDGPQAQQSKGEQEPPRESMSTQEIEQLLQKIRDREQIRRAQKLAAQRQRTTPARKDW